MPGSSNWSFRPGFPTKTQNTPVLPHKFHTHRPSHFLDSTTRKILGEQYRSLSSYLCSFLHSHVTSSLLGPNILLSTLFSNTPVYFFYVLLTVHLSIFILAINQLDAQNLFYDKFILCLYMFRAPCAHHQEVKIVLYTLWYYHTYRWPFRAQVERESFLNPCTARPPTECDDNRGCIIQF